MCSETLRVKTRVNFLRENNELATEPTLNNKVSYVKIILKQPIQIGLNSQIVFYT